MLRLPSFAVVAASLTLLAGTALVGCGGSSTPAATVPADANVVINAVSGIQWEQKEYTATSTNGAVKIAVENLSNEPHNLNLKDSSNVVVAKTLNIASRGSIDSGTFTLAPGVYAVFCLIPGHSNMKATLTVD